MGNLGEGIKKMQKSKQMGVRMPMDLYNQIQEFTKCTRLNESDVLIMAVNEFFLNRKREVTTLDNLEKVLDEHPEVLDTAIRKIGFQLYIPPKKE